MIWITANLGMIQLGWMAIMGFATMNCWGELNRYTVNFDENNNPIDTVFAKMKSLTKK